MTNHEPFAVSPAQAAAPPRQAACWLFHEWTIWTDIESGNLVVDGETTPVGRYIQQERRCVDCNRVQLRCEKCR